MDSENGNTKQILIENEEIDQNNMKQKNKNILYYIFGCCLNRNNYKRKAAIGDNQDEDTNKSDYVGQYSDFQTQNDNKGQNSDVQTQYQILSFNKNNSIKDGSNTHKQKQNTNTKGQNKNNKVQKMNENQANGKHGEQTNVNDSLNVNNTKGRNDKNVRQNQAINHDSSIFGDSGSGYDQSQASNKATDLRSSSLSVQTHNYHFDISCYITDQIFLLGKVLQLMVYIKEQKFQIDYLNCVLPDEFQNSQQLPQFQNSKSQNSNSVPQSFSYNFRESLQYQGNSTHRNSRILPSYEFNPDTIKYYRRRQIYFSKFQQGIYVDQKCWPHLVPECIVQHIAKRASLSNRRESLIDASCAVGQFSIAFANHISQIISIETDPLRFAMARNNAQVYGITNCKYNLFERISFNEAILFYNDYTFMDDQFTVNANLSDCVFLAPHLLSQNVNNISSLDENYFQTPEFYESLKKQLKKAFKLAPQVILLTPRNVKIIEVLDSFTDAIKENLNKVKKCSLDIEKYFINDHLKYICFYFGEFGRAELTSQAEFKYINQYLEKCYSMNKQKQKQVSSKRMSNTIDKKRTTRIHQQVFMELGKFQLLNIVYKFNLNFKFENLKINEDQTLLSLFYAYLISHNFMSQARISYIISRKQYTNSNLSNNTNNLMVSEIKEEDDKQLKKKRHYQIDNNIKRVSSFTTKQGNELKSPLFLNDNTTPRRTETSNHYHTDNNFMTEDDNSHMFNNINNNGQNNFDQNLNITWDEELKQENKSSKSNLGEGTDFLGDQKYNMKNIMDFRKTERTLSNNSNYRSTINDPQQFRHTQAIYQEKNKNGEISRSQSKAQSSRTMTDQSIQFNNQNNENENYIYNDYNDKEALNKNFNQNQNNLGEEQGDKYYSETETESDYEYEEDSSFSKNNLNQSQNTNNQVSFLRRTQRVYESKIENSSERNKGNEKKKSYLSNQSQQMHDQDQLIVFHSNFFEQNKSDISLNGNNMNTSFNLMNTSRLIAQEINNEQNQKDPNNNFLNNNNFNNIIPTNIISSNSASFEQKNEDLQTTLQTNQK